MTEVLIAAAPDAVPIHLLHEEDAPGYLERSPSAVRAFADLHEFKGKAGQVLAVPGGEGRLDRVLAGVGRADALDAMVLRGLPARLPPGDYRLAAPMPRLNLADAATAWGFGSYRFDRYRPRDKDPRPRLVIPDGVDLEDVRNVVHACALARDMINTPANDMGPHEIESIAREVAEAYGARFTSVVGDALLEENYPALHAVGRGAAAGREPRMVEIAWTGPGAEGAPLLAIVGKGVVFDTGGLDIKPSAGMRLMKKDMGGAAHALALGRMIMAAGLKVRLVVLLPLCENAISGASMRPGDVLASRKGFTIEVGNTDAEGRLILADALARAAELEPDLTIDLATLTGAARVALGPQIVPFYTADDALAAALSEAAVATADPLWRLPLWPGYEEALDGDIADLKNDPDAWAQAGSITAALFLQRFAPKGAWAHFDIFAWNAKGRPGWLAGAEVQAIRALLRVIKTRYGA
jgi:leucyl aminopeptidase